MLVLSRKLGESIRIDDNIEVVITSIQGSRVTLGITAPKNIPIQRAELQSTPKQSPLIHARHLAIADTPSALEFDAAR